MVNDGHSMVDGIGYEIVGYLLSRHYDIYGLINKCLALDINILR
jgi:hypothetical protein